MPFVEVSIVSARAEFVALAELDGANRRELCRRFGISAATGYKWLRRALEGGAEGLADRPRRPHRSPRQTSAKVEAAVVALRDQHPAWGGRKLAARLAALGYPRVPHPSTITDVLRRHQRLSGRDDGHPARWQRFEREFPNQLWQMDFKGHVPLGQGEGRCHPLTVLDDHSRYALAVAACPNERGSTVQTALVSVFRRYGLPDQMVMDNGAPWGASGFSPWTPVTVWLARLGIAISHGRAFHPQTQGKDERFHRTLKAEVLVGAPFPDLARAQVAFDRWRAVYNHERPHEALGMSTPITRYRPSTRSFPETMPTVEYRPGDLVRKVQHGGDLWLHGRSYTISRAFRGHHVGIRPTDQDGLVDVYFYRSRVAQLDLSQVAD